MNLEENAKAYSNYEFAEKNERNASCGSFVDGYKECKLEIIAFLKSNQKATVKQVLEHLNQMK